MAKSGTVDVGSDIERGRELCAEQDWAAAFSCLSAMDPVLLSSEDLELLAASAYMLSREDAYLDAWELAYRSHLKAGDTARAALCTWWIGDYLRFRGDSARATGWFARGHRLVDQVGEDCVARGFLLLPTLHSYVAAGDHEAASAVAVEAGEIGARFADRDLTALAMMERGHALVRQGRASEGLRLVDETMVAVTSDEPSPVIAGIVYCTTIAFCQAVFDLGCAQEWTEAHTAWCERQSDMRAYMGACEPSSRKGVGRLRLSAWRDQDSLRLGTPQVPLSRMTQRGSPPHGCRTHVGWHGGNRAVLVFDESEWPGGRLSGR
jgi:hypothetical protein